MPEDGGVLNGQSGDWALLKAEPVSASDNGSGDDGGLGIGGWVGLGVAVLVVLAGVAFLARRRGASADDRE
jgi:peptide/nickel transport system substrate-binding protein